MIAQSRTVQCGALILSASACIAAFQFMHVTPQIQIASAGAAQPVTLGNAFADMTAGVMTPIDPTETVVTPAPTPTVQPEAASTHRTPTPTTSPTAAITPVTTPVVNARIKAVVPVTVATPSARPPQLQAAIAANPVQPVTPTDSTAEPVAPQQTVTATDGSSAAPSQSVRPTIRPAGLTPPPRRQAQRQQPQAAQPRGNANQNARQGEQTTQSRDTGAAQRGSNSAATERSTAASNAAISNYPGQVMRRISRVRKPRTNARGAALVSFSVTGDGGLGAVSLQRSSGSATLDAAAVQVVQRAAPFPAPPNGAQTRFHIEISGR